MTPATLTGLDDPKTPDQARDEFPIPPSRGTVIRWMKAGIQSDTGEVVKLAHAYSGNRIYTTRRWCREFRQRTRSYGMAIAEQVIDFGREREVAEATAKLVELLK